jgi:predicted nucleic acid-binding protein
VTALVLDASVALTWFFGDRATAATESVLRTVIAEGATAPVIWPWEVGNVLIKTSRRIGMPTDVNARELRFPAILMSRVTVAVEPSDVEIFERARTLALRHRLSSYDAACLELAIRLGLPLATLDRALIRAAGAESVTVLPDPVA